MKVASQNLSERGNFQEALEVMAYGQARAEEKDGSGKVTGDYGISQVPETYVLNRQGQVVLHLAGPITDPGFATKFRSALAKAAA